MSVVCERQFSDVIILCVFDWASRQFVFLAVGIFEQTANNSVAERHFEAALCDLEPLPRPNLLPSKTTHSCYPLI